MNLIKLLKKIPIDLGQGEFKHNSIAKRIALGCVTKEGPGKKLLDIGCRDGYWSEVFKKKGYQVSALDISPQYSEAVAHDVEKGLPYGDSEFDVVWSTEVIEHLHSPKKLIREIDRILKKDGVAVLTTPNSSFWLYYMFKLWGWTPKKVQNPDHKQFFSYSDIKNIAGPNYKIYGYFPYFHFLFRKINRGIGILSPSFILVKEN